MQPTKETDHLRYRGNKFPAWLGFVWAALILFAFVYLARYMWPDLLQWIHGAS